MKKIIVMTDVSNLINPVGGPSICMKLLQNEIKKQITVHNSSEIPEIIITSSYLNIKDSVVWHWSPIYDTEMLDLLIENNNIIICGPNSFFRGGNVTEYEKYLIENKKFHYLFLHPKQYSTSDYFKEHTKEAKIYEIIYPVDFKCFMSSNNIEREYDVLIYKKYGCEDTFKSLIETLKDYKTNVITYGNYKIDELIHLSARSKCCIYLSCGETGGTACAEILCNGCPIISYYGNLTYGDDTINCIKLPDNGTFIYKPYLILEHIKTCMKMNNNEIATNARIKFNTEKIAVDCIQMLKSIALNH